MTTLAPQPTIAKRKIHSTKIDMTPMVDLGFLLITFFIFTAALSQRAVTKLIMPKDGIETSIPDSKALTVLLGKDKAYSYEGLWEKALAQNKITATDYNVVTGFGNCIRNKQRTLAQKEDLVVLIKPLPQSSYLNIIAALDEMIINNVKKYALVDAGNEEKVFSQNH